MQGEMSECICERERRPGKAAFLPLNLQEAFKGGAVLLPFGIMGAPYELNAPLTNATIPLFCTKKDPADTSFTRCSTESKLAGVAGFEPTNDGVRVRCLTAWRHPNIYTAATAISRYIIMYNFKKHKHFLGHFVFLQKFFMPAHE